MITMMSVECKIMILKKNELKISQNMLCGAILQTTRFKM